MEQAVEVPRIAVLIRSNHCNCFVYCQPCHRHSFSTTSEGSVAIACGRSHAAYECGVKLHDHRVDPAYAMQTQSGDGGRVLKIPHCDCFFHFSICLAVGPIQERLYGFTIVDCGCRIDLRPCRLQAIGRRAQTQSVEATNRQVLPSSGPSGAHILQDSGTTRDYPIVIDDEDLEVSHVMATSLGTGSIADPQREPDVGTEVGQYSNKEDGQSSHRNTISGCRLVGM